MSRGVWNNRTETRGPTVSSWQSVTTTVVITALKKTPLPDTAPFVLAAVPRTDDTIAK